MAVLEPVGSVTVGERRVDSITVATIWHSLQRTAREMRHLLHRTGQSFLIAQSKDISTGILDAHGATLAVPAGMPPHFLGGKYSVEYILREFGDEIYPGDIFLSNDPYHGYTCHPPDWGFFRPIFHQGKLAFWAMCRTHMEDSGAAYPGGYFSNPYDVHAEGLLMPATKIIERGQEQREVLRLIWNNIRMADGVRIDSYAAIAATRLCEDRMLALLARYGDETVRAALDSMIARTERAVRGVIAAIPDGSYHGESSTDDDGVVLDVPVTVRVEITVRGDELTMDFSRSDPQQQGFVNSTWFNSYSCAMAGLALSMGPEMADYQNEGLMRPVELVNPEGRVTNSVYPAPCGGAPISVGQNVIEAVMQAMSEALPQRAAAAWGRRYGQYIYSHDLRTGKLFVYPGYEAEGGAGAVYGYDGFQGTGSIGTLGEIVRPNTEDIETRFPWRTRCREFRIDSCGAGRWRGGPGFTWETENLGGEAWAQTGAGHGETTFGQGALCGCPTPPNVCYILRNGERIQAKVHRLHHLLPGDHLIKMTGGGGGVGLPQERDPQAVWDDVYVHELVSLEAAREVYRVAIDPSTRAIDWETTRALRANATRKCAP